MEAADLMVILKPKEEWTSASTWPELANKMTKALEAVPGVTFGFQYPVAMRFNELMTGAKQDVVCKLFGENLDTLSKYARLIGNMANKIEGAENVFVEPIDGLPQLVIRYRRDQMARHGLSIAEVNKVVNIAFAGQSSGLLFEDEKRFDLVLRLAGENRKNPEDVNNLLVPNANGMQIPLSQVADISLEQSVNQIQRDDAKRRIFVGFNVNGTDVETAVNDLQQSIAKELKLPSGYYITYSGAFENLNAAKERLMIAVPVSLVLILVLLYFAFGSLRQGLLIYSAIPLSAIGGILFLYLRGMPFSISAGIGFIALFGVAVLNGIVLLSEFNRIRASGINDSVQVVLMGTASRLRPVLMTAFVASLGFLPMAISSGSGAEVQKPLATVVIGGLIVSTFLTLFVLPILYILFSKKKSKTSLPSSFFWLLPFMIFSSTTLRAQTFVSLEVAQQMAMKNNLAVQYGKLNVDYAAQRTKSSSEIPLTELAGEYGQLNSAYQDNRLSIGQTINFPIVYQRKKELGKAQQDQALFELQGKEAEVKREVSLLYYAILVLREKEKLLRSADSLYASFLQKAMLRLQVGEADVLEKVTAESQRQQIAWQLREVRIDLELSLNQFRQLLNTKDLLEPASVLPKVMMKQLPDSFSLRGHPLLKMAAQQTLISQRSMALEKSRFLPDIGLFYNNMSMRGTGADNVLYNSSSRFQSAQLKVGIPLWMGPARARVKAATLAKSMAENSFEQQSKEMQTKLRNTQILLNGDDATLQYFETEGLLNASLIEQTATEQLNKGAINYLDWVLLINQSISIRNEYFNVLKRFNENAIQLNYLTSRP
jgi:cobalt-zinc-cadmium resistance protein CzcA